MLSHHYPQAMLWLDCNQKRLMQEIQDISPTSLFFSTPPSEILKKKTDMLIISPHD